MQASSPTAAAPAGVPVCYGIPNCDTMKKAFAWFAAHGQEYRFHDYRKHGLDAGLLRPWVASLGWKALVNTRGTTWRKIPVERQSIGSDEEAIALMVENPSLIRRPVLALPNGELLVGFDPATYATALSAGENA